MDNYLENYHIEGIPDIGEHSILIMENSYAHVNDVNVSTIDESCGCTLPCITTKRYVRDYCIISVSDYAMFINMLHMQN